uniref:(northern house mosquito) hypothetical protein n=1 Tax=Culex pipiens TaxID=7175 RepID=A0A8D8G5M4_CULPI
MGTRPQLTFLRRSAISTFSMLPFFHLRNRSSQQPSPQSTSNLCKKLSADLRSNPEIADKTIDCLGLGVSNPPIFCFISNRSAFADFTGGRSDGADLRRLC